MKLPARSKVRPDQSFSEDFQNSSSNFMSLKLPSPVLAFELVKLHVCSQPMTHFSACGAVGRVNASR